MKSLKDMATKQVLLDLRRKVNKLIADNQMEDPAAAEAGAMEAEEVMEELGDEPELAGEEVAAEDEEESLEDQFRSYINPKPKPRKPGTGVMIAMGSTKAPSSKKGAGKPRRDAV